jgi:twitching motility protein PilT
MNFNLPQLLKALLEQKGSDLHLTAGAPPRFRINGELLPIDVPSLSEEDCMSLCYSVLTDEQTKELEENFEIDLAFNVKELARFRANIFMQRGSVSGAFRAIPFGLKSIKELELPLILEKLSQLPHGLILVTGPTGSGKSTTIGAMINFINETYAKNIITIEDPIELIHADKKSMVRQRELGQDTKSFERALKSVLRQDPDVILIGELRDLETIRLALSAAETGHLVFATLHTNSCVSSLTRLIDVFPGVQQSQVRSQLASAIQAVLSQHLVPSIRGARSMAMEIMIPNSGIRNLIREDKFNQIYGVMQAGQDKSGMRTLNQSLAQMVSVGKIASHIAKSISADVVELEQLLNDNGPFKGPSKN